jgi:uracil-DNA glycosylase family 4
MCPNVDTKKALRRINSVDAKADIFIVSQALAENQLRKTGVNFFSEDGQLGSTGKNLEKFLNKIERTVYPPNSVLLNNSRQIPKRNLKYVSVYNSEIVQCYPGKDKNRKGDRRPSAEEVKYCLRSGFLLREIEILRPKILLLMGRLSRDTFFHHILNSPVPMSLSDHISQITHMKEIPEYAIGNLRTRVLPIQHASGANPHYSKLLSNSKLIEMMAEALQ